MQEVTAVDTAVDAATQAAPQAAQQGSWGGLFLYCLIIFVIIYFFMVRPNKRRMAEYQKMIDSI